MKDKQIEIIDRSGAKTVTKKTSYITWVRRIFAIVSIVWIALIAWLPLHVKNNYSGSIKKSIVVSMFFDLQRNIAAQYEKLLDGIKKSIDLGKPIGVAISKVKIAGGAVDKVATATGSAKNATSGVKKLTGIAGRLGVKTGGVDNVIGKAGSAVAKIDNTAKLVNDKLDSIEKELAKISQTEVDKMIDDAIKHQLDKNSGGLGTTLLADYGIRHVYPWRPSSWPVAVKIYNDLEKSDVGVIRILTSTVDKYFGYVAWGLIIAAWLAGLIIWIMAFKKVKMMIAPFIVCPRCGHAFVTKRSALGFLKIIQPWKWL
ncbi:MAG: hypothetical protein LBF28_02080 [Rickettsiales bacterium]|jgi:hypothetical protein|nr:hypothetical protein [Rickettsiales bacterium]